MPYFTLGPSEAKKAIKWMHTNVLQAEALDREMLTEAKELVEEFFSLLGYDTVLWPKEKP